MQSYTQNLEELFKESHNLEEEIKKQLAELKYE